MAKKMSDTMLATAANKTAKAILSAKKKLAMLNIAELKRLERIVEFEEQNFLEATGHGIYEFVEFVDTCNEYETKRKDKDGNNTRVSRNSVEFVWKEDAPVQPNRKVQKQDGEDSSEEQE